MLLLLLACSESTSKTITPVPTVEDTCSVRSITRPDSYTLSAPVTVRIDDVGVPHLSANNDLDLFFASGYQVASDRLFAVDQLRRQANGTLSEVWGAEKLGDDQQARTFGFAHLACASLVETAARAPEVYDLMVAYLAGVNRRVDEVNAGIVPMPVEFGPDGLDYAPEHFVPADIISMGRRISLGFSPAIDYDILTTVAEVAIGAYDDVPIHAPASPTFILDDVLEPAGPLTPVEPTRAEDLGVPLDQLFDDPEAVLSAIRRLGDHRRAGSGSNNWAVNGQFTLNGRPMIANDPHSSLYDPNVLYLYHLDSASAGGSFDVVGFAFLGVPGVQLGHNRDIAWAATTNEADTIDLWAVDIDDDDQAWIGGSPIPVATRDEPIYVRQSDGSLAEVEYAVRSVPGYGVLLGTEIIPEEIALFMDGQLMVRWTGFEANAEEAQYIGLNRAETLADFEAAVDYQTTGLHNWVGADQDGMRYKVHGLIPLRGGNPTQVQDADDPNTLWQGWAGPEVLPYLDGSQDYIVTANNDPWGHTADDDPLNDGFYYGGFYDPGFRAERIARSLDAAIAAGPVTVTQMMDIQMDTRTALAERLVPLLSEAWSAVDTDETLAEYRGRTDLAAAVARLEAWDGDMAVDSADAMLFTVWQVTLTRRVLGSDFALLFNEIDASSPVTMNKLQVLALEGDIPTLTDGRSKLDLLLSLDEALVWQAEQDGALGRSITWGDTHFAAFRPFVGADRPLAVGGDATTPNVSMCSFWEGDSLAPTCLAGAGAVFRSVTSFGDDGVPETWFNLAAGNAGSTEDWRDGVYVSLPFRAEEVAARTVSQTELSP